MPLTNDDQLALKRMGLEASVSDEGGMTCVEIPNFPLPEGFAATETNLLLRLNPAFPDVPPDMWWCSPPATRADGATIPATESTEHHLGRKWQRWSRHLDPSQWQSGTDSLESFIAIIRREFAQSVPRTAECA